ncbi:hypothetical protein [Methylobacterium sp. A54F]
MTTDRLRSSEGRRARLLRGAASFGLDLAEAIGLVVLLALAGLLLSGAVLYLALHRICAACAPMRAGEGRR